MGNIAIRVEELSKQYRIGTKIERYKTLRESLSNTFLSSLRKLNHSLRGQSKIISDNKEKIWALKDVSFEINHGEVIGIIGRNGAGKSTLLKILSRITEPTSGYAEIYGRVGSLLEVGTGFHSELTGRENIYLNGSIIGMKREEINRKFDEIVAFSEIEKFIDTPVKHYSSGMEVRLAFAVAAHLEPEILIVDEVLAVGDVQFQKKCLGRMNDVASGGRTVIFVSHQMASISHLCRSCILLEDGRIIKYKNTDDVIMKYLESFNKVRAHNKLNLQAFRPPWAEPVIKSVKILDAKEEEKTSFPLGSDLILEMRFSAADDESIKAPVMGVAINHLSFGTICNVNTVMTGFRPKAGPFTSATMRCKLKNVPFLQGKYNVDISLGDGPLDVDIVKDCLHFEIEGTDVYETGRLPLADMGVIFLEPEWELRQHKV
jgi:lipopolysaccharide transport system ATP-binding protein